MVDCSITIAQVREEEAKPVIELSIGYLHPEYIACLASHSPQATVRLLQPLEMGDPLGESVAAFVAAVQGGAEPLVQPEQAAQALETALLIEEAAEASMPAAVRAAYARRAAMA